VANSVWPAAFKWTLSILNPGFCILQDDASIPGTRFLFEKAGRLRSRERWIRRD
jgi:hypothetical protein